MKRLIFALMVGLALLILPGCSTAGPVTAEWDLSIDDAYLGATGGYRLYVGVTSGVYPSTFDAKAGVTSMTITLPPGQYYGAMSAFDSRGLDSGKTDEVQFNVIPGKPTRLRFR